VPASLFKKNHNAMKTIAIIPSAGSGIRMSTDLRKQYLELNNMPILAMTAEKFEKCELIDSIILVVPAGDIDFCKKNIVDKYNLKKVTHIIAGGERRQDSVRAGIEATEGKCDSILIHDGVRPLVTRDIIIKSIKAHKKDRAVVTALPAKDTIKKIGEGGYVLKTYDRRLLWLIQTPQLFRYEDIHSAHIKALMEGWDEITDDALLMEKMDIPVKIINGSYENIKITTPLDLEFAEFLLSKKSNR
jgi:2-C-methyl-D-erythritol 4-phosphate cytidylyltransferase